MPTLSIFRPTSQPRFSGWSNANTHVGLQSQVEAIESTIEQPIPEAQPVDSFKPQVAGPIREIQEMLAQVDKHSSRGMKDAIRTLRVLRDTGYQLTDKEADKLQLLMTKSDGNLRDHIVHFPKTGYYDYPESRQSQDDLNLLLPHWIRAQKDYRPLVQMIRTIDQAPNFVAAAETEQALVDKLSDLRRDMEDPETRQAFLKANAGTFRPKAQFTADLETVMDFLLPGNTEAKQQAVELIATRHQKIDFAGRTGTGELYVITDGTNGSNRMRVFFGQPGELQELWIKSAIAAMDGSDTVIQTEDGRRFEFQRGGMFNPNDKSRWVGKINNERVAQEFPTDELETKK